MTRLAIFATHPIQYYVPWFRYIHSLGQVRLDVYYGLISNEREQGIGYHRPVDWGVDLLSGYRWYVAQNKDRGGQERNLYRFFSGWPGSPIRRRVARTDYDAGLVLGWHTTFLIASALLLKRCGIPVLVRGDSNLASSRLSRMVWAHRILFSVYDRFLYVGERNRYFYKRFGVEDTQLFPARHFVDNAAYGCRDGARSVRGGGLTGSAGRPVKNNNATTKFIFVGKLEEKKCVADLIDAAGRLVSGGRRIELHIAGDGKDMQRLKARCEERGVPAVFHGFVKQKDLARLYGTVDCLVLPSDARETWGLVVNEAMAAGLPVVVSDAAGCVEDLVMDGENGYRFPHGDVDALARRLDRICAMGDARLAMGKISEKRIASYSVEAATEGLLKAINSVAG